MEDDPDLLRRQAARWRRAALAYDDRTAKALIESAQALEDRAGILEAARSADSDSGS